jgi:hypothetical protein
MMNATTKPTIPNTGGIKTVSIIGIPNSLSKRNSWAGQLRVTLFLRDRLSQVQLKCTGPARRAF